MGQAQSRRISRDVDLITAIEKLALKDGERQEVIQWLKAGHRLKVLLLGEVGAGKSTLVNSIVGEKVAPEGGTFESETRKVEEYEGLYTKVWDTPGMKDGSHNEKENLNEVKSKCEGELDLVLYCVSLQDPRIDNTRYEDTMKIVTDVFGANIWNNVVIVLTFANLQPDRIKAMTPGVDKQGICEEFMKRMNSYRRKLREALQQVCKSEDIFKKVPIEPAGHYYERSLPDREYWLSYLWYVCLQRTRSEAQGMLMRCNASRMKADWEVKKSDFNKHPVSQPIVVVNKTAQGALFTGAGVTVAAATGSVIGGVIGGTVLGVATMGVGVGIGAGVGIAAGGAIAVLAASAVALYRQNKAKEERQIMNQKGT